MLQIVLGTRLSPRFISPDALDPTQHWFDLLFTGNRIVNADTRTSLKNRVSLHGCKTTIRIGAAAESIGRTTHTLYLGSWRPSSGAGGRRSHQRRARQFVARSARVTAVAMAAAVIVPRTCLAHGLALRRKGGRLAYLVVHPLHPKLCRAHRPTWCPRSDLSLRQLHRGSTSNSASVHRTPCSITVLLGPTASGKSNAMLALIMDAIQAGRGARG